MVRDGAGRLTGLMIGMEEWLSMRLPRVTAAELESRARFYSHELAANGITAFTDATVRNGSEELTTFSRLVASGAIRQLVSLMLGPPSLKDISVLRKSAEAGGIEIAGVKFMSVCQWQPEILTRTIVEAIRQGADCAFHVTEIEELDAVIRACRRALAQTAQPVMNRMRIEHGGLIPPEYPEQIAAIGAWVVTNPGFIYYRGAKYAAEPGLAPFLYRGKSLLNAGIKMAAGTDAPVTPAKPLHAIAAAVARVSLEGYELALPEALAADAAFSLFTRAAAHLSRLLAGEITPGHRADLIALPADPTALQPFELMNLAVETTIVGGQIIYERGHPLVSQSAGLPLFS
jgi:predicted amidohydrolase YtcJ